MKSLITIVYPHTPDRSLGHACFPSMRKGGARFMLNLAMDKTPWFRIFWKDGSLDLFTLESKRSTHGMYSCKPIMQGVQGVLYESGEPDSSGTADNGGKES